MFTFGEIAWMFVIYSVIGWLWETSYVSIKSKKIVNRGFLRGPIIPLYGFAATTIMVTLSLFDNDLTVIGWPRYILIFLYAAVVASIWEYVTSALMESLFKTRWWDYSRLKHNIKGRVALSVSAFWGLGSSVLWFFVNQHIIDFYHSISVNVLKPTIIGIYTVVMVDTIFTLMELMSLRTLIIKLQTTSDELITSLSEKVERIGDLQLFIHLSEAKNNFEKKVTYRNIEGFKAFYEFLDEMSSKGKELAIDNESLRARFKEDLNRIKGNVRFFKNYPSAKTKHFQMVFVIRKIDFVMTELRKQMNRKGSSDD